MKKICSILVLLLCSFAAMAQPSRFTLINSRYEWLGGSFSQQLAIPKDTFAVATADKGYGWTARKGDSLYLWSFYKNKWIAIGSSSNPTLDQVLTAGHTSTQGIIIWDNNISAVSTVTGRQAVLTAQGDLLLQNASGYQAQVRSENLTDNRLLQLPNKAGTLATLDDIAASATTLQTLTDGATITWNYATSSEAKVTIAGNRTLSIQNLPTDGKVYYGTLAITQDATGSRTITLPAGSKVISGGAGAVTLTTTGGATDILVFRWNGTNLFWTIGKNYN